MASFVDDKLAQVDVRQDDWDASDDDKPKAGTVPGAAPKKKMTLKQKLAEKERLAAETVCPLDSLRERNWLKERLADASERSESTERRRG